MKEEYWRKTVLIPILVIAFSILFLSSARADKLYEISDYIIKLDINQAGDFKISEEISYHFQQGEFTSAYREVPGRGFSGVEFISLTGVDLPVIDYQVEDGSSLELQWEYPPEENRATFRLKYLGQEGLISREGRNYVDWQAVGQEWEVPIRNVEVQVSLPEEPVDLQFSRGGEPQAVTMKELSFVRRDLEAGEGWRIGLDFEEQVSMPEQVLFSDYLGSMIAVVVVALLLIVYRIIRGSQLMRYDPQVKLSLAASNSYQELSFPQLVFLDGQAGDKSARGLAALIFYLGGSGLIKLKLKMKDRLLGGKKAEIIIGPSETGDSATEPAVFTSLFDYLSKKSQPLSKVITRSSIWKDIINSMQQEPESARWFSERRRELKNKSLGLAISSLLLAIIFFLIFLMRDVFPALLPAVFLGLFSLGEFIRYAYIYPLKDEALIIREKITEDIEERREALEQLAEENGVEALKFILRDLPWLLLDNKMTVSKFKGLRKKIESNIDDQEAEEIELPQWLAVDGVQETLEAIKAVEYTFGAVSAAIASTATSSAAGGGAGGGGGGAG